MIQADSSSSMHAGLEPAPLDLSPPFTVPLKPLRQGAGSGEVMLSEGDAARVLSLSARTLQRHRQNGAGPAFVKLSERRIAYRYADLVAWVQQRRVSGGAEGHEHG